MDKVLICCALWSISHATYLSRMAPLTRFRSPSVFRPGVVLQRPIFPPRLMSAASHRTPLIVYRNVPHRYAMKPLMSPVTTRNVFGIPWKSTAHITVPVTPEYDFARAAPAQPVIHTDGAIHTIPAPNLSLSEKPIVVADVSNSDIKESEAFLEPVKPTYEVTETNAEAHTYNVQAKIETPTGFFKPNSGVSFDIKSVHNDATQQLNPEYSLVQVHQQIPSIVPQQFSIQKFNGLPSHQQLMHAGAEGIVIPPTALLQTDPLFLQKLQTELLQRYPAVEFIPYDPHLTPHIQSHAQESQQISYYFNNELKKQEPMAFVPSDFNRNIVQRQTEEGTVQSLAPHTFTESKINETQVDVTSTFLPDKIILSEVVNITHATTTVPEKNIDNMSENNKSNPIYYSPTVQSNTAVNSIYSDINDLNEESSKETVNNRGNKTILKLENITTAATTSTQEINTKHYLDNKDKLENNEIMKEYKNYAASPFEKPAESVNIAYSLFRATETAPKDVQNTTKIADRDIGPIVRDDARVNSERSLLKKGPVRFSITEKRSAGDSPQPVIRAKIPPKSKLIFDDKTGEPILRVYASYVDNPARKEAITQKLTNMRLSREAAVKKQEPFEHFDAATVNALASDVNQYGLKIKPRNDASSQILLEEYN